MKYIPPKLYFSPHIETILPAIFRRVKFTAYQRERIATPDGDFLDLDWLKNGSEKLIIISHGLEGNSHKPYVRGMAKAFSNNDCDVMAWNYRGCSGEINKQLRFYHSGATDDLNTVISHALSLGYQDINLIGFSLGGNITLKYLGENGTNISPAIKKAIAFSVPMNLHASCIKISESDNILYSQRFLRNLKSKVKLKARQMPGMITTDNLSKIKTLIAFDDAYTAPIHGFKDAIDYYTKCSSLYFVEAITTPTLIVNALNDPFLTPDCTPVALLKNHKKVTLETPAYGGHVGFTAFNKQNMYWSEQRAIAFINDEE